MNIISYHYSINPACNSKRVIVRCIYQIHKESRYEFLADPVPGEKKKSDPHHCFFRHFTKDDTIYMTHYNFFFNISLI